MRGQKSSWCVIGILTWSYRDTTSTLIPYLNFFAQKWNLKFCENAYRYDKLSSNFVKLLHSLIAAAYLSIQYSVDPRLHFPTWGDIYLKSFTTALWWKTYLSQFHVSVSTKLISTHVISFLFFFLVYLKFKRITSNPPSKCTWLKRCL